MEYRKMGTSQQLFTEIFDNIEKIVKCKVRFVARGDRTPASRSYYSPVAYSTDTISIIFVVIAIKECDVCRVICTIYAFLHAELDSQRYYCLPKGHPKYGLCTDYEKVH